MPLGFLTPDFPPEHKSYTRQLQIPATAAFLGLVNGALFELTKAYNFEQDGEMTPQETADFFTIMFTNYLHNLDEPPEWETPDDLDGQPEQPWYESLSDWIIQGFLAVTFTPAAAIVYTATVPKLRVAIRTGNLGALFRVLINGIEVWTGDSYAPITDLIEQVFDMSAETEPYTVRIEHNGVGPNINGTEAKLEYIRGEAVAQMVQTILRGDPGGCGIQWSTDDGGTWNTIDLAGCITDIANDTILQAIEDGIIPKPAPQPSPETPPEPGLCQAFHIVLRANDKWLLPYQIASGWTVAIANVSGIWNDGTLTWFCPDGHTFFLGVCTEGTFGHEEGDPDQTEYHMQLVGNIGDLWFDPVTALYTVPPGTDLTNMTLQANDGSLSDNAGQIEFDLTVCVGTPWCQTWDFTVSEQGFAAVDGHATYGDFNGVIQWGAPQVFDLSRLFSAVTLGQITSMQIDYATYGPRTFFVQVYDATDAALIRQIEMSSGSGDTAIATTTLPDGHDIILRLIANDARGVTVKQFTVRGQGTDPFGEDNCT